MTAGQESRGQGLTASRALDRNLALAVLSEVEAELWAWSPTTETAYRLYTTTKAFPVSGTAHDALVALQNDCVIGVDRFRTIDVDGVGHQQLTMFVITTWTGREFLAYLTGSAS